MSKTREKNVMSRPCLFAIIVIAAAIACAVMIARAGAHETAGPNEPQTYVSHPDASVSGTPVQILAANPKRVSAICQNVGPTNSARVGDASVGASQGTMLAAAGNAGPSSVVLDTTGAVYGYSAGGTTLNCGEVVRP